MPWYLRIRGPFRRQFNPTGGDLLASFAHLVEPPVGVEDRKHRAKPEDSSSSSTQTGSWLLNAIQ